MATTERHREWCYRLAAAVGVTAVVVTAPVAAHSGHRGPLVTLPYVVAGSAGSCLLLVGAVCEWRDLVESDRLPVAIVAVGVALLLVFVSGVRLSQLPFA